MADAPPPLLAGLRGVVVGVSGENSIGYHCALRLRALGADVALTTRPARRDAVEALVAPHGMGPTLAADFDDEAQVAEAFAALGSRLDFLVHTLVHVPPGVLARPLLELSRDDFDRTLHASAYSLVLAARHAAPRMAGSPCARIVTLTSASAQAMTPSYHVAGIAKAALAGVLLYLAQELGPRGILCNAVSTSLLATDGAVRAVGAANAAATRAHLAKRAATRAPVEMDQVADCVAWLCSPLCRNVTAETVSVDGGFSRSYF